MRALITGADGFTGRYLAGALKHLGYHVTGLFRKRPDGALSTDFVDSVSVADLLDDVALQEVIERSAPTVVAHLAAISSVDHGDVREMYEINIVGSRKLLAKIAQFAPQVRCVLLASSANIYGNASVELIDESTPPAPANDYGVSKLAMEYLAKTWFEKLPITIVRPFNYTGVGQSEQFVIPKIVGHFARKAPSIELGNIHAFRDYSDVRDVATTYADLLHNPQPGKTFNVSSGIATSPSEIIGALSRLSGHRLDVSVNPNFVRANEITSLRGNEALLRAMIPAQTKKSLEETLLWMYEASFSRFND
jgi:GDP-6-deoxy-D-talose 4-dehydrogenase